LTSVIMGQCRLIGLHGRSCIENSMRGCECLVSTSYALLPERHGALLELPDWLYAESPEGRKLRYDGHG
jgi:hypothetical protein